MSLCILAGGKLLMVAASTFSLVWTHSVEKTEWQEDWQIIKGDLQLTRARVKGSGAGMDPGDGAQLVAGWWQWHPEVPAIHELHLAASGATVSGWSLCPGLSGSLDRSESAGHSQSSGDACLFLGAQQGETITIRSCRP